jgi:hypothetical protein
MNWRCSSSVRAPALQVQTSEFKPSSTKKKKTNVCINNNAATLVCKIIKTSIRNDLCKNIGKQQLKMDKVTVNKLKKKLWV